MRKTTYLKSAFKNLEKLDRNNRNRIIDSIDSIPRGDIKKLAGKKYPQLYRLRVGKHRVIYYFDLDKNEIIIAKIDTRGDIYK